MDKHTCRWPGCERPARSWGLCNRDIARARREGNFEDPWTTWAPKRTRYPECRWPDCQTTMIHGHGLCDKHYQRAADLDDMVSPWRQWDRACAHCRVMFTPVKRTARFCSARCARNAWRISNPSRTQAKGREYAHQRRARKRAATVETFTPQDVRMRTGDDCYLCGKRINFKRKPPHPMAPSLDHIVPLSRGGDHTLENVAFTHLTCNKRKWANAPTSLPTPTLLQL